jgi:hypothetical protein
VLLREALICALEGALGGAEAPLFHGISEARLCIQRDQDQDQRQRTGVSAPHEQRVIGTSELVPFPISRLAARVELAAFAGCVPVFLVFFCFSQAASGAAGIMA